MSPEPAACSIAAPTSTRCCSERSRLKLKGAVAGMAKVLLHFKSDSADPRGRLVIRLSWKSPHPRGSKATDIEQAEGPRRAADLGLYDGDSL